PAQRSWPPGALKTVTPLSPLPKLNDRLPPTPPWTVTVSSPLPLVTLRLPPTEAAGLKARTFVYSPRLTVSELLNVLSTRKPPGGITVGVPSVESVALPPTVLAGSSWKLSPVGPPAPRLTLRLPVTLPPTPGLAGRRTKRSSKAVPVTET